MAQTMNILAKDLRPGEYPEWDFQKLVKLYGTARNLRNSLRKNGLPVPSRQQIFMWKTRQSIPQGWLAVLLACACRDGLISTPLDVMTVNQGETA